MQKKLSASAILSIKSLSLALGQRVTSRHNISAIEVKSGEKYTLSSLRKCLKKFDESMSTPYVIHSKDFKTEEGIVYIPLYMTPLL